MEEPNKEKHIEFNAILLYNNNMKNKKPESVISFLHSNTSAFCDYFSVFNQNTKDSGSTTNKSFMRSMAYQAWV